VLVVEDEILNALLLEAYLEEAGFGEVVTCTSVDEAIAAIDENEFDFALLDINLNGTYSFPIAKRLSDRGIPFGFQSAYGKRGLSEAFRNSPVIEKPYHREALIYLADHLEKMAGSR
jgi:CheY-like chemotaxis protein